jgi:hypothetical protein
MHSVAHPDDATMQAYCAPAAITLLLTMHSVTHPDDATMQAYCAPAATTIAGNNQL